jgi:hypothetical protein
MYFYLFIILLFLFVRYIILQYYPNLIINGYFSLFISFYIISYIFTKSIIFSIIIGFISINIRILYRNNKSIKVLNNYNSLDNIFITCIGLIILFFVIIKFDYIDTTFKKYYNIILLCLILINLFFLKINKNNNNLLCFS